MPFLDAPLDNAPRAIVFDVGRVIIRVDLSRLSKTLGIRGGRSHLQALRELEANPRWPDWQEGRMSPRDWNWLLDLLENPPAPNARLKAALKHYRKARRDDAGTAFNWKS